MSTEQPQNAGVPEGSGGTRLMGGGSQDPLVGKRFGNCLLQRRIGAGAMGYVYVAHHVGLNKLVAIKIMSADLIGSPANVARFLREAQLAASLEHPNVVQVFDVGEANGLYYLAMQYVEGRSLDKVLDERRRIPAPEALGIIKRIALALAAAHKIGIIHRDIKPANILVSKEGQIKVADFGLARSSESGQSLSTTGQIVGTPYYMSPEQSQARPVDSRADLYSLGATFYHLVTGRRPFEGDTPISIILKHVNEDPIPPDQVEPSVPPAVSQLILKLMAKNPDDRFATGEDLVRAMTAVDAPGGVSAAPAPGAEKILELGGESMIDLFGPSTSPAASALVPGAPGAEKILELGGESLLDMGPGPGGPPAAAPPPATRQTSTGVTKEYHGGKDTSPEGLLKAEGKPVLGKFLLIREIQREDDELSIWEAENCRTKARVSLRVLKGFDSDRIRTFYKLAAEGTHLKHPNIVHVMECHSDTDKKGGVAHFMAVELVQGLPLDAVVSARMLPPRQLLQLCGQVADALEFAHEKQKLHLTLSPSEIQIEPPTRAMISYHSFGPSQKDDARAKAEALARAPFMAPEQVPNVDVVPDATTDVYRLGAVLYWIATGREPFASSSLADYYQKILSVEPAAPRAVDPKIDAELETIILTAMRKQKELRYAKASELAAALRKYLKADAKDGPGSPSTRRIVKTSLKARLQIAFRKNRKAILLSGGALVLLGALAGAGVWWRNMTNARSEEAAYARAWREAISLSLEGKYEEAQSSCARALAFRPDDPSMKKVEKECVRKILETSVLRQAARIQEGASEVERAVLDRQATLGRHLKDLLGVLSKPPATDELSSLVALGVGHLAAGNLELADEFLGKAAAMDSKDPAMGLASARVCFARIVLAAAAAAASGVSEQDPRSQEWRGRIVEALDRPTQPAREGVESDLADVYSAFGRGEIERVKSATGGLLLRGAGSAAAEATLVRGWTAGGTGAADLAESVKGRPVQTLAYVVRGLRSSERGQFTEAVKEFGEALRWDPDRPLFSYLRAKARLSAGDVEGAVVDVARARLLAPKGWAYQTILESLESILPGRLGPPK